MKHAIIALFALVPALAFANTKADFAQIDAQQKACLDNPDNYSTYGMNMCIGKAYDAADKVLGKVYAAAVANLKKPTGDQYSDESQKESLNRLVKSERAWIAFRDSNSSFYGTEMLGGSGESQVVGSELYDMTKARALEIEDVLIGSNH